MHIKLLDDLNKNDQLAAIWDLKFAFSYIKTCPDLILRDDWADLD